MKKISIALLVLTLVFSVAAIASPNTDKTPKAKKANKTTTVKKETKKAVDCYYFKVTNNVNFSFCSGLVLEFPTNIPPTTTSSFSCDGPQQNYYCVVGFPGYINVGTAQNPIYHPSTAPNGGSEITDYCSYSCAIPRKTAL